MSGIRRRIRALPARRLTVAVIVVHLGQHVDGVGVKRKVRRVDDTQGIQLMTKGTLPEDKLGCIRPVEAIYAVGTTDAVLDGHRGAPLVVFVVATKLVVSQYPKGEVEDSLGLVMQVVGERLRPRVEEARHLD